MNKSFQEEFIKKILSKPFKIPIPNYVKSSQSKTLGARKSGVRQALHDPDEPNALVLYTPIEMSAHESLHADKYVYIVCPKNLLTI